MSNITYLRANIFNSPVQALVNPINCQGVMGKGLALQFRKRFPRMYEHYCHDCRSVRVRPGTIHVFANQPHGTPRRILNFPTKDNWRQPSRLEYIQTGLDHLTTLCTPLQIESIAIPPLGCGLGGLRWSDVQPLIDRAARSLPNVQFEIYKPR